MKNLYYFCSNKKSIYLTLYLLINKSALHK